MFLGFQKLLSNLRLLKLNVYLQYETIVPIISSFVATKKFEKIFKKRAGSFKLIFV